MAASSGKWQVIPAGGPTADSVRETLQAYLDEAWRRYRRAMRKGLEDAEHAHQARVWARRATAAIDLYRDWVPGRTRRRMREGLQALRLAADNARGADIWFAWLSSLPDKPGLEAWLLGVERERRKSYRNLARSRWKARDLERFRRRRANLLARVSHRGNIPPLARLAEMMAKRIERFFEACPHGGSRAEEYHRFRIAGKKLRHTLELTGSLFGPEAREDLHGRLKELLDHLGEMNDLAYFSEQVAQSSLSGTETGLWLQDELLIRQQQALGKYWECGHPDILRALRARFEAVCLPGD